MKYVGKCIYDRKAESWKTYLGSGKYLVRAISKYGKDNFTREIIHEAKTSKDLEKLEEFYIRKLNAVESKEFYNLKDTSMGGDTFSGLSQEDKLSARVKKSNNSRGNKNGMYGKDKTKHFKEQIKKANSVSVQIEGVLYSSMSEASVKTGYSVSTISYYCSRDDKPEFVRLSNGVPRPRRKVFYKGTIYDSLRDVSKVAGRSTGWIKREADDKSCDYCYFINA